MAQVVSAAEFREARNALLVEEKALTKATSALAAKRRKLPMTKIENPERFKFIASTSASEVSLVDLFENRKQLIIYDFMLNASDPEGKECPGCSFSMDHVPHGDALKHLFSRDTTFAAIATGKGVKAEKAEGLKRRMGWDFPFYVKGKTMAGKAGDEEDITWGPQRGLFGVSCFLKEGDEVFHTYETSCRGVEGWLGTYTMLDWTKMGRQEAWEGNGGEKSFKMHDQY